MKPKMKDTVANNMALLVMIGQCESINGYADMAQIAAYAGLSKPVIIDRVFKMCAMGYVHVHQIEYRANANKFVVTVSDEGKEVIERGFAKNCFNDWKAKKRHVETIRIGSQKSIFI